MCGESAEYLSKKMGDVSFWLPWGQLNARAGQALLSCGLAWDARLRLSSDDA